jgi:Uncharacterized conserved protein (DUF2190)
MNFPLKASGPIPQWRFAKVSAADTAAVANAATDTIIGIHQTVALVVNDPCDISGPGEITFIEAGAAFAAGSRLTADATGRGVAAAPAAGVNNGIGAIAIQAATAAGDIVRVLTQPHVIQG